jgi:hypothetical protein
LRFARSRADTRFAPTYGAAVCELRNSDPATRRLLAAGYRQWWALLVGGLQRMQDRGDLVDAAKTTQLAWLLVSAHQCGDALSVAFQRPWPDPEALAFALSYLRSFATNPAQRTR